MVTRSRSSLMCLQSDQGRDYHYDRLAHEEWRRALDYRKQRLRSRCKHLDETFRSKSGRQSCGLKTPVKNLTEAARINIPPSDRPDLSVCRCSPGCYSRFTRPVRGEQHKPTTPHHIIIHGDNSAKKPFSTTPKSRINTCRGNRKKEPKSPEIRRASIGSSLQWCFQKQPDRCSPQRSIESQGYIEGNSDATLIPIDVLLACKLGIGESTPSCDRSFTIIDCPERQHTPVDHHQRIYKQRQCESSRQRKGEPSKGKHKRHRKSQNNQYNTFKASQGDYHHRYCPCRDQRHKHNEPTYYTKMEQSGSISPEEPSTTSSLDEVERSATSCIGSTRHAVVQRSGKSQSVPRRIRPKMKIDADYLDRIASGNIVNMDVLKAPQLGSSESTRYNIAICREIFMGVIGAQVVYAATSLMFGNIAAAVIVSLLCVQGAFCHCDGRPVAYVVNGFLSMLVGITITTALFSKVSGLEPYYTEPVLRNMSYIYVPLCYLFGLFSFFLAYSYHGLHKQERRAIVQAVNRLVGDRYYVNENSLALERKQ